MNLVPDLLTTVGRLRRGEVPTLIERQALLDGAREGMMYAGFAMHLIDGHIADLTRLLSGIEKISLMASSPATVVVPSARPWAICPACRICTATSGPAMPSWPPCPWA
jgi:hypothetical protein